MPMEQEQSLKLVAIKLGEFSVLVQDGVYRNHGKEMLAK